MQQQTIGQFICDVDESLADFHIQVLPSSAIEYLGYNAKTQKLFTQFNSGKSYIYDTVPPSIILNAARAESLTKYLIPVLKGFPLIRFDQRLVTIANV